MPHAAPPPQRDAAPGNSMFGPVTGNPSAGSRSGLNAGPQGRWWDNKTAARAVGIRSEQKARMDAIFNANRTAILTAYETLLREQARLAEASRKPQVDKTQLFANIDAVNQARTSLEKATAQMLLDVRAQLDPDQIARLESLH